MLEVEQRHHDAQRHPRAPGVGLARQGLRSLTKPIQIGHGLRGARLAREQVRHRCLEPLPRHARGQHHQRVAQIDHGVQAGAEKVLGGSVGEHHKGASKNLRLARP